MLSRIGQKQSRKAAPKALAAAYLHHVRIPEVKEAVVLFSAGGATLGSMGQSNYTAANAVLDSLALARRCGGLAASSLQPSNVGGLGSV